MDTGFWISIALTPVYIAILTFQWWVPWLRARRIKRKKLPGHELPMKELVDREHKSFTQVL